MYPVVGVGTIPFRLQSSKFLYFEDVLFFLGLKNIFLSFFIMEDKGFVVEFKKQQVLIRPKYSISALAQVIEAREGNFYKL
jgi:hypothetical protein